MSIKIDIGNQVRQTVLPQWKPLLPLFEAVMNSFQAIRDARLPEGQAGLVKIDVVRSADLFGGEDAPIHSFIITDNGIGLDDENFDSFNTAFSRRKADFGGKGLGRFTWLKAFEKAVIQSIFRDSDGSLLKRSYVFSPDYDLDTAGLPEKIETGSVGTVVHLYNLQPGYVDKVPRTSEIMIQKIIEHFILVFIEKGCPDVYFVDGGVKYHLNQIFDSEYRRSSSTHGFEIDGHDFVMHGFRLPTGRTTKHRLVYAADQRAVLTDKLEESVPNLGAKLLDENGNPFFYLAILQSPYLSDHVNGARTDFDFSALEDQDQDLDFEGDDSSYRKLIPRADIRKKAIEFVQVDLGAIIKSINEEKLDRVRKYIHQDAPQYRVLLRNSDDFINLLPPSPNKNQIEAALHRELHNRETELKKESSRIIKEADKIDNYEDYHKRFTAFINEYNELGMSALAQYVGHRKIILEFLERAIHLNEGEDGKYPLEEVVHKLVFPMQSTSSETPYNEQNLWMIDERLTYHSFIASDKKLKALEMLKSDSALRGDIVIFDEKIIFSDVNREEHPINSITIIEFKRPGRNDYTDSDNPLSQSFRLVDEIRRGEFKVRGRPIPISNALIPASIYCICDLTPTFRSVLRVQDAFTTPDNQGYYGFHRGYNAYYEVVDYTKMLRDAKNRNKIFFEKLNLVNNH